LGRVGWEGEGGKGKGGGGVYGMVITINEKCKIRFKKSINIS
jgi:hypothetical protein